MVSYIPETPEEITERSRLGLALTPYHLPNASDTDKAMAWELLSRYVSANGRVTEKQFGGDCIALGRLLGRMEYRALPWWRRLFANDKLSNAPRT